MRILKKVLKWLGISLLLIILIVTGVVAMRQDLKYEAPYPEVHASKDSAVIAQGKYLFFGPAHCIDCHGNKAAHPELAVVDLPPSGGFTFKLPIGNLHAPNITSDAETGIGKLSDGDIARTLRYGVGSDGRALMDFMPFHNTSDEDLAAIISYLRTIPPIKNEVPRMEWNTLGRVINAFLLKPVGPDGEVAKSVQKDSTVEYGKYLSNSVANCRGCHTNRDLMTGAFIGPDFGGGLQIDDEKNPGKLFVTRNISPDPQYGHMKDWSLEVFKMRFKKGRVFEGSPMPWEAFGTFDDVDLTAIYKFLQTVKPVNVDAGPVIVDAK